MINVTKKSLEINQRFFDAIDALKRMRKLRGLDTFSKKYGFVSGNMYTIKYQKNGIVKAECLHYLARDYNVSPEWLLLGTGEMFIQTSSRSEESQLQENAVLEHN